ncbi:putative phosphoribosyltransferase [Flavobacterium sp. CG_9.1]|nr:putative phosphoribosyltransferase [Flavobacterium sp. CG_9.1]
MVYIIASNDFSGVGSFYELFNQVEDEEVIQILSTGTPTV